MKVVLQRVIRASVEIDNEVVGKIANGLVVLVGVAKGDTVEEAAYLVEKISNLRIFEDESGRFNRSLKDINGEMLIVSQFTLLADCRKGRRPGFDEAALPDEAERIYNSFIDFAKMSGIRVATGKFQTSMLVNISNKGPVTIVLERTKST